MEVEDDMVILVVVDEKGNLTRQNDHSRCSFGINHNDFEIATERGKNFYIKEEGVNNYSSNSELLQHLKKELTGNSKEDECVPEFVVHYENSNKSEQLKPKTRCSFVAKLREEYPELKKNKELLVDTLEQIMRSVKTPPPPRDFYIMNGIMFECVQCGHISVSIPAASRHYQEKHGERYLVCYACGDDFRSKTNLYKHEKRCAVADAVVVLRARAAALGRKGRSRPFLQLNAVKKKSRDIKHRFPCQLCSASFTVRSHLKAHENLHRGERPYLCHACPSAYTSHSALWRHVRKHMDVQYVCDHCGRSFKIKEAIVAHMDTHKPLRKHGCEECGRRFAQKSALLLHVNRVHRNLPPPCACHICPKRYRSMSLLKEHMKIKHGMSIITRKMFLKSLPRMTEPEMKKYVLKQVDLKSNEIMK